MQATLARPAAKARHPGAWVPTAYLAEGIPFAMVQWVSGTMLKDFGYSDGTITPILATIGLAWSAKPLWAAFLDMYRTKKFWILAMEFFMCALLALMACSLRLPNYFTLVVILLTVIAFASATQDICVDGVYITALDETQQATWAGTQGVFWTLGRLFATALIVEVAGLLKRFGQDPVTAWMGALGVASMGMGLLAVYHYFILPTGSISRRPQDAKEVITDFGMAFVDFFRKKAIWGMLLFVFLYRTGEGFLLVEAPLFIQGPIHEGGLGLSLDEKALIDGTVSTIASFAAGLAGGAYISRHGLRKSLFTLALAMNIPHICYIALSQLATPDHRLPMWVIMVFVTIEKCGYSFGMVGNMVYMMQQMAPGRFKMTHYAFATALMNFTLFPTQFLSGPLANWMNYRSYFIFVLVASIPSVLAAWFAPFPVSPEEGKGSGQGPSSEAMAA
jgi:PAT family beta-lactamase induction signal transducer AmpG